jgi:hypothetical protein
MVNSRPMRVDKGMQDMIRDIKMSIAKREGVEPRFIPTPLATKKIVDWATLGRQFEQGKFMNQNKSKPQKKRGMDVYVENFGL